MRVERPGPFRPELVRDGMGTEWWWRWTLHWGLKFWPRDTVLVHSQPEARHGMREETRKEKDIRIKTGNESKSNQAKTCFPVFSAALLHKKQKAFSLTTIFISKSNTDIFPKYHICQSKVYFWTLLTLQSVLSWIKKGSCKGKGIVG